MPVLAFSADTLVIWALSVGCGTQRLSSRDPGAQRQSGRLTPSLFILWTERGIWICPIMTFMARTHSELIRASQEESRMVHEQLRQFIETFSLRLASQSSCPPQPPPTHDPDTQQSDDNELYDDSNIDA
ncbi:hypothetical protein Fmac_008404 [Flemingia macrophylla]|uniref:Uncharacterized protein n=1 Tax=Flemingia macrophylla TaxID=520843 RepID=A0ABD1MXD7_9FABA